MRLAQLARDAALSIPGVLRSDTGTAGLFVTVADGDRIEGVICAASRDGGYEVSLRLVCEFVPLPALVAKVDAAVHRAGARAGISVSSVHITISDLAEASNPNEELTP